MNHYQTLGVREGANPAEILWAYESLQKAPDLDIEMQLSMAVAYQTLIHPSRRFAYDNELRSHQAVPEPLTALPELNQYNRYTTVYENTSAKSDVSTYTYNFFLAGILGFGICSTFLMFLITL